VTTPTFMGGGGKASRFDPQPTSINSMENRIMNRRMIMEDSSIRLSSLDQGNTLAWHRRFRPINEIFQSDPSFS
jgi:hypothetical protein